MVWFSQLVRTYCDRKVMLSYTGRPLRLARVWPDPCWKAWEPKTLTACCSSVPENPRCRMQESFPLVNWSICRITHKSVRWLAQIALNLLQSGWQISQIDCHNLAKYSLQILTADSACAIWKTDKLQIPVDILNARVCSLVQLSILIFVASPSECSIFACPDFLVQMYTKRTQHHLYGYLAILLQYFWEQKCTCWSFSGLKSCRLTGRVCETSRHSRETCATFSLVSKLQPLPSASLRRICCSRS